MPFADYDPVIENIKNSIPFTMAKSNIPGLAIALIEGETPIWSGGFGYTDRSRKIAVTGGTLFSIQSISKTYVAFGFLIAASKGQAKLDDPLRHYLPEFKIRSLFGDDEVDRITFRHLLSHRSGLCHEAPVGNNYDEGGCSFGEHIQSIQETWLKFPVGERYSYSNLGIDLIGHVLEKISGKKLAQFMTENVFEPLKMHSSTFNQQEVHKNPDLAIGHYKKWEIRDVMIPMLAAGGMYSTANDMAKFISFNLSSEEKRNNLMVDETLLKEMSIPQFAAAEQVGGYGLGISILPYWGGTVRNHNGGGYGCQATQQWVDKYRFGVVVLTNQSAHDSVNVTIANRALNMMVEKQVGSVSKSASPCLEKVPVSEIDIGQLRRLEGSYVSRSGLRFFKVLPNQRLAVSYDQWGNWQDLNTHSLVEFSSVDTKYTFEMDEEGNPQGVYVLNTFDLEFLPLNDTPRDNRGPDLPDWRRYVGVYTRKGYCICRSFFKRRTSSQFLDILRRLSFYTEITLRNGYLYQENKYGSSLFHVGNHKNPNQSSCRVRGGS